MARFVTNGCSQITQIVQNANFCIVFVGAAAVVMNLLLASVHLLQTRSRRVHPYTVTSDLKSTL